MLLTNLLLACGLSGAVGSGLALKENSNYLHHEKPQEQLHLDNKKNAVSGDLELNTWYIVDLADINEGSSYTEPTSLIGYFNCYIDNGNGYVYYNDSEQFNIVTSHADGAGFSLSDNGDFNVGFFGDQLGIYSTLMISWVDSSQLSIANAKSGLKSLLTLSDNQDIGGSVSTTTQEVFEVVGETTTGFIDVLTSAIEDGTELIYKDGNFTFLGVMLLVATGVSVVFWIFRLLRGITEGVSR